MGNLFQSDQIIRVSRDKWIAPLFFTLKNDTNIEKRTNMMLDHK